MKPGLLCFALFALAFVECRTCRAEAEPARADAVQDLLTHTRGGQSPGVNTMGHGAGRGPCKDPPGLTGDRKRESSDSVGVNRVDAGQALSVLCPGRLSLAPAFARAAERHRVPAGLLVAVSRNETNCNPAAIGMKGERGMMQLKPGTRAAGNVSPANLHRPEVNADLAGAHLARCLLLCGDWAGALGVFAGHKTCSQGRASGYARRVLGFWEEVKGAPRT